MGVRGGALVRTWVICGIEVGTIAIVVVKVEHGAFVLAITLMLESGSLCISFQQVFSTIPD